AGRPLPAPGVRPPDAGPVPRVDQPGPGDRPAGRLLRARRRPPALFAPDRPGAVRRRVRQAGEVILRRLRPPAGGGTMAEGVRTSQRRKGPAMPAGHPTALVQLSRVKDVTVTRFPRRTILDPMAIEALGEQLLDLVDEGCHRLVLDFTRVESVTSAMFGK